MFYVLSAYNKIIKDKSRPMNTINSELLKNYLTKVALMG